MPESELFTDRLAKEAQVLIEARTAITTATMNFILYYVLANKHIRSTLREELNETMTDYLKTKPSWANLEKLLYLQIIIKEGLR